MPVPQRHLAAVGDDTLRLSERIRLARSILQARHWAAEDQPAVDEALMALDGDGIDEILARRGA